MKVLLCCLSAVLLINSCRAVKSHNSNACECVPYYQCNNPGLVDDRNESLKDNNGSKKNVPKCENYLDVCCPINTSSRSKREEEKSTTNDPPVEPKGCGHHKPEGVGFTITDSNDGEAKFGEFPWMAAVLKLETMKDANRDIKFNVYQCGGALIHPQIVLTAAHCVDDKEASTIVVRVGDWDTQTKNEVLPHQQIGVKTIIVNENYNKTGAFHNDFGLLILNQPVDFKDEHVGIVCLPKVNENFDRSQCLASGWGKDSSGHYRIILKRLEMSVVPRDQCQNTLRTSRFGKDFQLDTSFICAGNSDSEGTCKGDDGSPLVCPMKSDPKKYVQAGIVAWESGCGENQDPGVFANVAVGRNWIEQQATKAGFNITKYQSTQ